MSRHFEAIEAQEAKEVEEKSKMPYLRACVTTAVFRHSTASAVP
jgi:hypothetical protein